MDATRFDTIAKLFAARRLSRRAVVRQGSVGLAALAATGLGAAHAQEATPAPEGEKTMFLFVQSFQSGSITPKEGEDGTYTLTLDHDLGQTIYFSDRPERIVGAAPTPQFLDGLGFAPDNPPNAALVVETAEGQTDLAVVELTNPTYETTTRTATYDVTVLAEWEESLELGFREAPSDLAAMAPTFGAAHLFIDDCPDITTCYAAGLEAVGLVPGGPVGTCWNWVCQPCDGRSLHDLEVSCNQTYDKCYNICTVR